MGTVVMSETIGSLKGYIESASSKYASVEIYRYKSAEVQSGYHTDILESFDEFSLDELPDKMPCAFEFMDDEEYNETIDANCDHIPFSEYLEGENPLILVVVLPYKWEEYLDYYTLAAGYGVVDDNEYNDGGEYYGNDDEGNPLFSGLDSVDGKELQKYSTLADAEKVQHDIVSSLQTTIEFNEEVNVDIIRHYREDGEWYEEADGEFKTATYQWKDITGAYVVKWSWKTHVGYCRHFYEVFQVTEFDKCHDESLLVEEDATFVPQCSLLFTAEEVKKMEADGSLQENFEKALLADRWKWQNVGAVKAAL